MLRGGRGRLDGLDPEAVDRLAPVVALAARTRVEDEQVGARGQRVPAT